MNLVDALTSQYTATFAMLERCIRECPDALWADASYTNRFWQLAFHTIFYAHLYFHDSTNDFVRWEKHTETFEFLSYRSKAHPDKAAFSKEDLLEYLDLCNARLTSYLPTVNFEEDAGVPWLSCNKLELHIYSIRHTQHHTGQLGDRLREVENRGVSWIKQG